MYVNHTSHSHGIDIGFTIPPSTTSSGKVGSRIPIFHSDEYILESLTPPDYPWDDMNHHSHFLPQHPRPFDQYVVESKDFIPHNPINWFKNPIPAPDAFEEGNMANI